MMDGVEQGRHPNRPRMGQTWVMSSEIARDTVVNSFKPKPEIEELQFASVLAEGTRLTSDNEEVEFLTY